MHYFPTRRQNRPLITLCLTQVFKTKSREGHVERVIDAYSIIGKNLFKKETNIQPFTNLKVTLSTGQHGVIEGGFGQSGKVKVRIPGKNVQWERTCAVSQRLAIDFGDTVYRSDTSVRQVTQFTDQMHQ